MGTKLSEKYNTHAQENTILNFYFSMRWNIATYVHVHMFPVLTIFQSFSVRKVHM